MIWTNGLYTILGIYIGFKKKKKIHGIVIKSYCPSVREVGEFWSVPLYHLETDEFPQFIRKGKIKNKARGDSNGMS